MCFNNGYYLKGETTMVRHIVAWNYAEGFTEEENKKNALQMRKELENLINLIPGIVSIQLYIDQLDTSDSDMVLDSVFESEEALKAYAIHPEHVRVGTNFVKPSTRNRKCIDFFINN
jgi:heme-degrading monooxygenase HmoA